MEETKIFHIEDSDGDISVSSSPNKAEFSTSSSLNQHLDTFKEKLNRLKNEEESLILSIPKSIPSIYYHSPISPSPYHNVTKTEVVSSPINIRSMASSNKVVVSKKKELDKGFGMILHNSAQVLDKATALLTKPFNHGPLSPTADNLLYYRHLLRTAGSYEHWHAAAHQLDRLEGREAWKEKLESKEYDYELIKSKLDEIRKARESGDVIAMMFLLRTTLCRNLGDMGNPKLYSKSLVGTKKLIEDYNDEVIRQFMMICDASENSENDPEGLMSLDGKLDFFINTRQAYGRTALLLSGGATLGLYHVGVVKALYECNLLPRIISGSSIGSLIASLVCTKTDKELFHFLRDDALNLNALESEDEIARLVEHGVILDVEVLKECIRSNIGDVTFQEAYNRTRRILNITVSSSTKYEMPKLLNYLTAPNVIIWSAVAASCAIPLFFKSAPLVARDKFGNLVPWNPSGHKWIDGSVENDLPMTRLSELLNVNHFIVCQVNPHVVPFLLGSQLLETFKARSKIISSLFFLAKSELQHRISQMIELEIFPTAMHRIQNILSQKYYGDITIIPDVNPKDYLSLMSNPSRDSLWEAVIRGDSATWPKMNIIKNHCQIELLLDEVIYILRCRKLEHVFSTFYSNQLVSNNGTPKDSHHTGKWNSYKNAPLTPDIGIAPYEDSVFEGSFTNHLGRSLSVGRMNQLLVQPPNSFASITSTGSVVGLNALDRTSTDDLKSFNLPDAVDLSEKEKKDKVGEIKTAKGQRNKFTATLMSSLTITPLNNNKKPGMS